MAPLRETNGLASHHLFEKEGGTSEVSLMAEVVTCANVQMTN